MRISVLLPMIALVVVFGSMVDADAMSCSQRHRVCLKYCADQYAKFPHCTVNCGEALSKCTSNGCWVTPQANKCGYSKN
jgi:hypothetical protein